jgi:chaperone BCS1
MLGGMGMGRMAFQVPHQPQQGGTAQRRRNMVTLSGLLNAIDGNASQEGRLLIMTSNNPDALDSALTRPGRIDKQIYFGNMSRSAGKSIFKRLIGRSALAHDAAFTMDQIEQWAVEFADKVPANTCKLSTLFLADPFRLHYWCSLLEGLRTFLFAFSRIFVIHSAWILTNDIAVSPAQVQNFLQGCRGDPLKALNDIDAWIEKNRTGGGSGGTRASNRTSDTSASFIDPVSISKDLGDLGDESDSSLLGEPMD